MEEKIETTSRKSSRPLPCARNPTPRRTRRICLRVSARTASSLAVGDQLPKEASSAEGTRRDSNARRLRRACATSTHCHHARRGELPLQTFRLTARRVFCSWWQIENSSHELTARRRLIRRMPATAWSRTTNAEVRSRTNSRHVDQSQRRLRRT